MKTLLLIHNDPRSFGGYQRLSGFLQKALDADIYNIKTGEGYNPDDYDYFVAMDDPSVYKLPLYRPHTAYMTTPRRSLYDMYYTNPWYIRAATWLLRVRDQHYMSKVNDFVAISHTSRIRIFKTYGKEAEVIYPCIDVSQYHHGEDKGYWLAPGRIAKWKRIPMIVDAFREMPDEQLILFGEPVKEYEEFLKYRLPKNVRWEAGGDAGLIKRYAECRGVITMGVDEDFGIVPLEAMASGKYVVAPNEGGYKETLREPRCGALINPSKAALIRVVRGYNLCLALGLPFRSLHALEDMVRDNFDYSSFVKQWRNHANLIVSERV